MPLNRHVILLATLPRETNSKIFLNSLSIIIPINSLLKYHSTLISPNPPFAKMGTLDIPPPHVPSHTIPISSIFLQIGGSLWTICYILYVRESFRSKSYGMPLFALALNFGWEIVYGFIAEYPIERVVFFAWLLVDCGIVYGMLRFAKFEWEHAPVVKKNIGWFFALMAVGAVVGHGAFASWWIENEIGKQEGKFYKGVVGPDISELGYWSAVLCQLNLSAASLCQLVIRQHSGGVSWGIW